MGSLVGTALPPLVVWLDVERGHRKKRAYLERDTTMGGRRASFCSIGGVSFVADLDVLRRGLGHARVSERTLQVVLALKQKKTGAKRQQRPRDKEEIKERQKRKTERTHPCVRDVTGAQGEQYAVSREAVKHERTESSHNSCCSPENKMLS